MGRKPGPKRHHLVPRGKLYVLNMRTTADLREKLEAAAEANGRSLSAEVEERLYSSFVARDEIFGDQDSYRLMIWLASAIKVIEGVTGESWRNDLATRLRVVNLLNQMVNIMANPESREEVNEIDLADEELILDLATEARATYEALRGVIGQKFNDETLKTVKAVLKRVYSTPFPNLKSRGVPIMPRKDGEKKS